MNIDNHYIENIDQINNYLSKLTRAAEYYPGGLMGFDQDGNVVSMQWVAGSHPKTLVKCGKTSDVYKLTIVETALIYRLVK